MRTLETNHDAPASEDAARECRTGRNFPETRPILTKYKRILTPRTEKDCMLIFSMNKPAEFCSHKRDQQMYVCGGKDILGYCGFERESRQNINRFFMAGRPWQ